VLEFSISYHPLHTHLPTCFYLLKEVASGPALTGVGKLGLTLDLISYAQLHWEEGHRRGNSEGGQWKES
jgi:hypothetical protein